LLGRSIERPHVFGWVKQTALVIKMVIMVRMRIERVSHVYHYQLDVLQMALHAAAARLQREPNSPPSGDFLRMSAPT
jgi:hypothetical protein